MRMPHTGSVTVAARPAPSPGLGGGFDLWLDADRHRGGSGAGCQRSASADRIKIPARAPFPVPTMTDTGVARPSAHGQAMIKRATADTSARVNAGAPRSRPGCGPGRLAGAGKIGAEAGKVISKYKMAKHPEVTITDDSLAVERTQAQIEDEARLDGIYVIRTPVPAADLDSAAAVTA
jgi:hypothetical protein